MNEVLVNHLFKLVQVKSVVKCTDRPNMTIAVNWDVKQPKNKRRLEAQTTKNVTGGPVAH